MILNSFKETINIPQKDTHSYLKMQLYRLCRTVGYFIKHIRKSLVVFIIKMINIKNVMIKSRNISADRISLAKCLRNFVGIVVL